MLSDRTDLLIGNQIFGPDADGLSAALATAFDARARPRCMCCAAGVEMYIARRGRGYLVKRMPGTGGQHNPRCTSYEPPAELSGLAPLLGTAIVEDLMTGDVRLRLDFSLSKRSGRSSSPLATSQVPHARSDGARLSLRGLLHYLWDQAQLTRWPPAAPGYRTWAAIRNHLLTAAEDKQTAGRPLLSFLYIPEPFSVDQLEALNARRLSRWRDIHTGPGAPPLMLMIAELKGLSPARHGYQATIKHLPDSRFMLDETLFRRVNQCFSTELDLWGISSTSRMIMISTVMLLDSGISMLREVALMVTTRQGIPVEDLHDDTLVSELIRADRLFKKSLPYNLPRGSRIARATLLDAGAEAVPLHIVMSQGRDPGLSHPESRWTWFPASEAMPRFPQDRARELVQRQA